jgi:hypothetical protein
MLEHVKLGSTRMGCQDFQKIRHELPGRLHQQESTLAISPVRRLVKLIDSNVSSTGTKATN